MKLLKVITDREILGRPGMSQAKLRLTARAIVVNRSRRIAVMYAGRFSLYSLVGGGIEEGEDVLTALRREVGEETGCTCDQIVELGTVEENRGSCDYTQISYYHVVYTDSDVLSPNLTDGEKQNDTTVQWHSFEDAYRLIASPRYSTVQRMYLQARDVAALDAYRTVFLSEE
ncbi:MAG: NUDIX hydrolase [Faecousia sp.]